MNIIDNFKTELNKAMMNSGVLGQQANNAKKPIESKIAEFTEEKDDEKITEYPKYVDYLEKTSDLVKVAKIIFSKTKSVKTKRNEVKKFLKDPEVIDQFFKSILSTKTKKEPKEAMATGGAYAAMDVSLFSKPPKNNEIKTVKESQDEEYCDQCNKIMSKCVCDNIKKVETKEATTSASIGPYDANSFQNIKMKGNTTKGKGRSWKKTQIPGGSFVQVKEKCKKFPYCNQGDIKALKIFKEEVVNKTIEKMCEKYNLNEDEIREIILKEFKYQSIYK